MRNRSGFIPKSSPIQPDCYKLIFSGWCAVFHKNDKEFHLQLWPDWRNRQDCCTTASRVEVLLQTSDCRIPIAVGDHRYGGFTTLKEAIEALARILQREESECPVS